MSLMIIVRRTHPSDEQQNKITYSILSCCSSFGYVLSARFYVTLRKISEDNVLVVVACHEKNAKIVQLYTAESNPTNPNFQTRLINRSGIIKCCQINLTQQKNVFKRRLRRYERISFKIGDFAPTMAG